MNNNDVKIKELLKKVESQRAGLGAKPKTTLVTNGLLVVNANSYNINTLNKTQIVSLFATMLLENEMQKKACKELGIGELPFAHQMYTIDQWKEDLINRIATLDWNERKSKLDKTEAQLKALVSEEVRTADTLEDIAKMLGSNAIF